MLENSQLIALLLNRCDFWLLQGFYFRKKNYAILTHFSPMSHFHTPWKSFQGVQKCDIGRKWVKEEWKYLNIGERNHSWKIVTNVIGPKRKGDVFFLVKVHIFIKLIIQLCNKIKTNECYYFLGTPRP